MKRVLCEKLPQSHQPTVLSEAEATHLTRVFRLKDGDRVEAIDGKGFHAAVTLRTRNGVPRLEFLEKPVSSSDEGLQCVPVTLEMAVLKGDAMEWVVEKAVELGIKTLVPVVTAHTVVQLDKKGPEAFRERWQKIADQALKQCGRLDRLEIKTPVKLEELLAGSSQAPRLWCDESAREHAGSLFGRINSMTNSMANSMANSTTNSTVNSATDSTSTSGNGLGNSAINTADNSSENSSRDELAQSKTSPEKFSPAETSEVRILIGPEGGWSELERDILSRSSQNIPVSLGPLVLRAETAAIFALSLVSAALRESK
jgi:16S rRNA (uracil1498-N3)-methyltransferase